MSATTRTCGYPLSPPRPRCPPNIARFSGESGTRSVVPSRLIVLHNQPTSFRSLPDPLELLGPVTVLDFKGFAMALVKRWHYQRENAAQGRQR